MSFLFINKTLPLNNLKIRIAINANISEIVIYVEAIYVEAVPLKCDNRTSLHAVLYKWQPGSVLMFCSYYFKNG